jgi:hypothetical protein
VAVLGAEPALDVEKEIEFDPILEKVSANACHLGDKPHRVRITDPEHIKRLPAVRSLQLDRTVGKVSYPTTKRH